MIRSSDRGFLDLLFNLLLGFIVLFIVSYLQIKPIIEKKEIRNKAEYLITVTWPDFFSSDVDTWVQDPLENLVWFRQKEKGLMHLDRDDLGTTNDTITLPDGRVIFCKRNQEQVTLRGFIPGEWIINLHLYNFRDSRAVPVKVTIDKINPTFKTVFMKDMLLETKWEEKTVTRFTMAADGEIIAFDDLEKQMVDTTKND